VSSFPTHKPWVRYFAKHYTSSNQLRAFLSRLMRSSLARSQKLALTSKLLQLVAGVSLFVLHDFVIDVLSTTHDSLTYHGGLDHLTHLCGRVPHWFNCPALRSMIRLFRSQSSSTSTTRPSQASLMNHSRMICEICGYAYFHQITRVGPYRYNVDIINLPIFPPPVSLSSTMVLSKHSQLCVSH
jgi:hypothetical protein